MGPVAQHAYRFARDFDADPVSGQNKNVEVHGDFVNQAWTRKSPGCLARACKNSRVHVNRSLWSRLCF